MSSSRCLQSLPLWDRKPCSGIITIVSGLFVVIMASSGVLALVPWGVRGLYEAPAVEYTACPRMMSAGTPCTIKHPAVISIDCLRAPVTVVWEVLGCQSVRDYIDKAFNAPECADPWSKDSPLLPEGVQFHVESILLFHSALRGGCWGRWLTYGNLVWRAPGGPLTAALESPVRSSISLQDQSSV